MCARAAEGSRRETYPRRVGNSAARVITSGIGDRLSARPGTVDRGFHAEEVMTRRRRTKLVRAGQYAAEVDVELIDDQTAWAPYLPLEDAEKLDDVRAALRQGDLSKASQLGRVFRLMPIGT